MSAAGSLTVQTPRCEALNLPLYTADTLVIGTGAAGLNAAVQLRAHGIDDVLVVTEGLQMGTSINTGSDKQTYYKIGMCGAESDSPHDVAEALFAGGSMHGDLALVEASLSARAFFHLVNLGVSFPRDRFGQFVGYKTDHDPRQRATSVGPCTSREMCLCLIREIERLGIPVHENRRAVSLLTVGDGGEMRAAGAILLNLEGELDKRDDWRTRLEVYFAENVIFAVGGPGGLYEASVYPEVHTGGIGLALMVGARAQNLQESQFGVASVKFRWNVSGSYMQVIPRFISTAADGRSDEQEFLRPYFGSVGEMNSAVFLKGYQWPFDARKVIGGSSLVDIIVYVERALRGRRVFLDFRRNSEGFDVEDLSAEAKDYLTKSRALRDTPLERLMAMNPAAVELYRTHGIDLGAEPLEVAVCAQHNNGGLAGNMWWESTNIRHLFPVGEVNGSHGVTRPGGSALNAGQVGGFRAAEYIANRYRKPTLAPSILRSAASRVIGELWDWISKCEDSAASWVDERSEFRARMSLAAAHVRSVDRLQRAVKEAWDQWRRMQSSGCGFRDLRELAEVMNTRQLCFAHVVYLEAILFAGRSGLGSRGSALLLDRRGVPAHPKLGEDWRFAPENQEFRQKVLETQVEPDGRVMNRWVDRRPLPSTDAWFETTWAAFKDGRVYDDEPVS